jgi:hypothetical protein
MQYGEGQGWQLRQTQNGPRKFFDENGVERMAIKRGSPRTPGSEEPHAAFRDESGRRVDLYGNHVSQTDPRNHSPINWDL